MDHKINGRVLWPHGLFEAKSPKGFENTPPKFSCSLVVSPEDPEVKALLADLAQIVAEDLGGEMPERKNWPLQNSEAAPGFLELKLKANANWPPKVVDQAVREITDPSFIQSGDRVLAAIRTYFYKDGPRGVGLGVNAVQFQGKGDESLGGSSNRPSDLFKVLEVDPSELPPAESKVPAKPDPLAGFGGLDTPF
jgi:hypothetical protein